MMRRQHVNNHCLLPCTGFLIKSASRQAVFSMSSEPSENRPTIVPASRWLPNWVWLWNPPGNASVSICGLISTSFHQLPCAYIVDSHRRHELGSRFKRQWKKICCQSLLLCAGRSIRHVQVRSKRNARLWDWYACDGTEIISALELAENAVARQSSRGWSGRVFREKTVLVFAQDTALLSKRIMPSHCCSTHCYGISTSLWAFAC